MSKQKRLIDVEALVQRVCAANDAAEVVRCKECIYRPIIPNKKGFLICEASGMEITDRDFCSYGERRATNG